MAARKVVNATRAFEMVGDASNRVTLVTLHLERRVGLIVLTFWVLLFILDIHHVCTKSSHVQDDDAIYLLQQVCRWRGFWCG